MSPKIVVSEDGVRYPAEFAERHGIKAAETRETARGGERPRTTSAVGTVVTDDAAGSVITSAAADNTSTTGVNPGLAVPAATAEAKAAEDAGKGSVGTTGAPDNTGAGAGDGGAADSDNGSGDADGTPAGGSTTRARSTKSK